MTKPTQLYQLTYVSQISKGIDLKRELIQIQKKSVENNIKLNVTGVLFCLDDTFTQILEGEKENITKLYTKISQDQRHFNLKILEEQPINERSCENWNMGILNLNISDHMLKLGFKNSKIVINRINEESSIRFLLQSLMENKMLLSK